MAHKHSVYDTDTHFSINPVTRALKNEASTKTTLIQHDHNSERFTFEIPRYIEGHDMSLCNVIQVHYNNINAQTKEQNSDVYEVDDMQISPEDENVVICSWLISQNATKHVGSLNFLLRFSCVEDDGRISYAWNTAIYSNISVSTGIYNTDTVHEEYSDLLLAWKNEVLGLEAAIRAEEAANVSEQAAIRAEEAKNAASAIVKEEKTEFEYIVKKLKLIEGHNLYRDDMFVSGYCSVSGGFGESSHYKYTPDLIPVKEGDVLRAYRINNGALQLWIFGFVTLYDENGNVLSSLGKRDISEYTVPEGGAFVRLTIDGQAVEITKNYAATEYEPYAESHYVATDDFIPQLGDIETILASVMEVE